MTSIIGNARAPGRAPEGSRASARVLFVLLAMQAGTAVAWAAGAQPGAQARAASAEVRYMVDWVERTGDNAGMPYIIVDKVHAEVFVLDANGRLVGSTPALLGMERGDGSAAGLGNRAMAAIRPGERTTPAGRFVASLGKDLHGQDILWIDYGNAIALHRVVKGTPAERRAQRLQSGTPDDNRISYGCINVPVAFFDNVVHPAFAESSGVVYVLPETSSVSDAYRPPGSDARAEGGTGASTTPPAGAVAR